MPLMGKIELKKKEREEKKDETKQANILLINHMAVQLYSSILFSCIKWIITNERK